MNKTIEIVLTAVALAGMYCALPKATPSSGGLRMESGQTILIADGSEPMPMCRGGKRCPK